MLKLAETYNKSKFRWTAGVTEWPYYKTIVGCGVKDDDVNGYFIHSDGSYSGMTEENGALVLLMSRVLAERTRNKRLGWRNRLRLAAIILLSDL